MKNNINNQEDVIDSRDIIKRIEELEGIDEPDEDEKGELKILKTIEEQVSVYASDWKYGEALIRRTYWIDYVQQLLEDCGDIPSDLPHYVEIDWESTANNIEVDYSTVDFDGVEYLFRCS